MEDDYEVWFTYLEPRPGVGYTGLREVTDSRVMLTFGEARRLVRELKERYGSDLVKIRIIKEVERYE